MTPQEKAITLRDKFIEATKVPNVKGIWVEDFEGAKQCALICVDEILNSCPLTSGWAESCKEMPLMPSQVPYWENVKLELEEL